MADTRSSSVSIACGGVFGDEIARAFKRHRPSLPTELIEEFAPPDDLFAHEDVVYVGACFTGGGASLGLIPTLVSSERCHVVGSRRPDALEIRDLLAGGGIVFGITRESIVPFVMSFCAALDLAG